MLEPWLDRDYIRKGFIDSQGDFRLFFADGGSIERSAVDMAQTAAESSVFR